MGEKEIKNIMEREKEEVAFKQVEKQADENISKIFNPENAYKRQQKAIIASIFGEENSCSVIKKRLNMDNCRAYSTVLCSYTDRELQNK